MMMTAIEWFSRNGMFGNPDNLKTLLVTKK